MIPQHCIHQAWVLVFKGWSQEGQKFKVILDYIASLRLAWATQAPLSKTKPKGVGVGECPLVSRNENMRSGGTFKLKDEPRDKVRPWHNR